MRHRTLAAVVIPLLSALAGVFILVLVPAISPVLIAQGRSVSRIIQTGGTPAPSASLVGLIRAEPLRLTGNVDSNSPAVWDLVMGRSALVILTSFAGYPSRSVGDLTAMTPATPVRLRRMWPGGGVWMESIIPAPSGAWYGYYHNEREAIECGDTTRVIPRIGAARSINKGETWTDLGIIIEAPLSTLACDSTNKYFDGGVGDLSATLDHAGQFVYFYFSQYGKAVQNQGIAVARMAWADRDRPDGKLDMWSRGSWLPPDEEGRGSADATPIFATRQPWHDANPAVDAFWGAAIHWNEYLEQYVMLLNRASDESFDQEGIYVSFADRIDNPAGWSLPTKILNGGEWYPQVIGLEEGVGSDRLAGREARFFMSGRSDYIIRFNRR